MSTKIVSLEDKNGHRVPLIGEKISIGRSIQNQIVLEDLQVSRIHCVLEKKEDDWVLIDMSSNGTLVNKISRSQPQKLKNGDIITLSSLIEYKFINERPSSDIINESLIKINNGVSNCDIIQIEDEDSVTEKTDKISAVPIEPSNSAIGQELTCSICTELFINATTLNCSHTFCNYCITEWRKNHIHCPLCRQKIVTQLSTVVIDNTIEKIIETASADVKETRKQLMEQRKILLEKMQKPINKSNSSDLIEIMDDDDDFIDDEDDANEDDYEVEDDYEDDDDWNEDVVLDEDDGDELWIPYNGIPGPYYGGYGQCYNCSERGHWANGCPNRGRRN